MPRHQIRHGLNLESLEARQMMAGDVSAYAISKILYINGDAAGNGIALVGGVDGSINVMGISQDGSATTINGGVSQEFTKIKDVVISMDKGDDAVVITDIALNGNLYVAGGKDNDVVALGEFADTGLIDDAVDALLGAVTVKKSAIIDTSDGDDTVLARAVTVSKSLVVSTGIGDDAVIFDSAGGVGDPGVTVLKTATITTSNGNDLVSLTELSVSKTLTISTGNDDDTVLLDGVTVSKTLSISTGSGNDLVELTETTAKSLTVRMGNDNDDFLVQDTTIAKKSKIDGDQDINTYADLGGNSLGKLTRKNFQTII